MNPGARRSDKRWPADRFRELARRLAGEAGAAPLVVWGPEERELASAIAGGPATLAPPTDLDTLLSVLRRASVVVAGDTGPLHLAAALGVPCVGLYGPTSVERNGPWRRRALASPDGRLESLSVAAVFDAVREALSP
jgi:ADP-heptose:LPS heptosyltransferase